MASEHGRIYYTLSALARVAGVSRQRIQQHIFDGDLIATFEPDMRFHSVDVNEAIRFFLRKSVKAGERSALEGERSTNYRAAAESLLAELSDEGRERALTEAVRS